MLTVTTLAELNDLAGSGKLQGLVRVSNDLYHAGPGLSSTGIKELLKSPAHYQAYLQEEQSDSAALRWGRLVHARILEPELFPSMVAVRPVADGRTTEGKARLAAFAEVAKGREVVTQDELAAIARIAEVVARNKLAASLFKGGEAEISVYWTDESTGVLCKARADYLKGPAIFDLKTCYSAKEDEFRKAVLNYGYHVSAAFYLDGFKTVMPVEHFAWVALEKTAPHCMGFYAAESEGLNLGRAECRRALDLYAACEKSGVWPGLPEQFINLSLGAS